MTMLAVKEILGANLPWTVPVTRDNLVEGIDSKDCPGNVQRPAVVGVECLGSPEQAVRGLRQLTVLLTQACTTAACLRWLCCTQVYFCLLAYIGGVAAAGLAWLLLLLQRLLPS